MERDGRPRGSQHALAKVNRMRLEVFHVLEHCAVGDVSHLPRDDSAGLATAVEIHGVDHAAKPGLDAPPAEG